MGRKRCSLECLKCPPPDQRHRSRAILRFSKNFIFTLIFKNTRNAHISWIKDNQRSLFVVISLATKKYRFRRLKSCKHSENRGFTGIRPNPEFQGWKSRIPVIYILRAKKGRSRKIPEFRNINPWSEKIPKPRDPEKIPKPGDPEKSRILKNSLKSYKVYRKSVIKTFDLAKNEKSRSQIPSRS